MKKDIEQQLKETLGSRRIAPSADAWERLAMNRQRAKKEANNKRKVFFYYAAAVAVFFMVCGYMFLSADEKLVIPENTPQVVNAEKPNSVTPAGNETVKEASPVMVAGGLVIQPKKHLVVAEVAVPEEKTQQVLTVEKIGIANANDAQLSTIVTTLPAPVSKDAEAELLLANATKNIALSKQKANATNDTALLKEVEAEMDDYYRDKAMKVFALKHKTIRFAVNKQ